MQTANVVGSQLQVSFAQSKYLSNPIALGRISRILDDISPDVIDRFSLVAVNADRAMFAIDIPRDDFNTYRTMQKTDALLESVKIYKPDPKIHYSHDYRPGAKLPKTLWKISPAIRSQIGGPDGFYFGGVSLSIHSELLIKR